ncbi:hypothetical protein CAC42_2074 [Sphaceloma murrayae]|uniref:Carboxylesterase family protein n=1 Tax=Sphaceloma murrayae TaxID=2082308 RepID=A0A2K1QI58_9PEZI|nr:hypothetical protein CAC42_2074 [Sphaceloma murrayae]
MRMTRAAAAALQETGSHDETQDLSAGDVQDSSIPTIEDASALMVNEMDSADLFRQSTRSKKGSKRGKKNMGLATDDVHVDEVTQGIENLGLGDSTNDTQRSDLSLGRDAEASFASSTRSKRVASNGKEAVLVVVDESAEPRPGSPIMDFSKSVLKPKSQAKQLLAKEKMGMRSTSNKENVQPGSPATVVAPPRVVAATEVRTETEGADNAATAATEEPEHNSEREAQVATEEADVSTQRASEADAEVETSVFVEVEPTENVVPHESSETALGTATIKDSAATSREGAPRSTKRASTAGKPSTRTKSSKPTSRPSEVNIPHSKPRPISLSFPTPPPPPKSTRPATKSTFSLPGEAVAAKLKAAKEARLARSASTTSTAEPPSTALTRKPIVSKTVPRPSGASTTSRTTPSADFKKPAFKARPVPKFDHAAAVVRPTKASRARESLASSSASSSSSSAGLGALKRASSVRESVKTTSGTHERRASAVVPRPRNLGGEVRARPQSVIVPAGPRMSMSGEGRTGTDKGKEVFRRAKMEQQEAVKRQREKEEAARRARKEASERGREMGRMWAERKGKVGKASGPAAEVEA